MANAVEVINLVKDYPRIRAVDGLSFNIEEGEVFGLLGPNGAGKTTTIRMLLTLIRPSSGSIRIFGVNALADPARVRQLAGYVPQDVSVDGDLTGYENMLLYAQLYDIPGKVRKELIREALEYMDLSGRANDMVSKYSGGMMRRLEIAQTLVNRPRVLYLDEPSIGLDPSARRTIWEHIEKLRDEFGTTILITTHDMNEADRLCGRIGIMNRGKMVTVGRPDELKATVSGDVVSIGSQTPDFVSRIRESGYQVIGENNNGHVDIAMQDAERQIPSLLENLRGMGISVETISMQRPTLDDVFLQVTGTHIEQSDTFTQVKRTRRTARRLG